MCNEFITLKSKEMSMNNREYYEYEKQEAYSREENHLYLINIYIKLECGISLFHYSSQLFNG